MSWWLRAGTVDRIVAADRAIRVPVPLSRRVGIIEPFPGVGSATVAAACATRYARRRHTPTLLVDATGSGTATGGALPAAGLDDGDTVGLSARRARPTCLADALDGLPTTDDGLAGLNVRALVAPDTAAVPADWAAHVGTVGRFVDVVVTDFGARDDDDIETIASLSHVVCVVTAAGRSALEAAVRLARRGLGQSCPSFVAIVADCGRVPLGAARRLTRGLSAPVHLVGTRRPGIVLDELAATALTLAMRRRVSA